MINRYYFQITINGYSSEIEKNVPDLENYGIKNGKCIDDELFTEIFKIPLDAKKDKTQRKECGCVTSIDIGAIWG